MTIEERAMVARGEGAVIQLRQVEARLIDSCTHLFGTTPNYHGSVVALADTLLNRLESYVKQTSYVPK